MKDELTPWHDGSVKPVHVGVYERDFDNPADKKPLYCMWNGTRWLLVNTSITNAAKESLISKFQCEQKYKWRGLANKPMGD